MPKKTFSGHATEDSMLLILAVLCPPAAIVYVRGCGVHFALNLIFFLFLTWIGAIIHAICIVVIYSEEEKLGARRKSRLRAQQEGIYDETQRPSPHYDTKPAYATDSQDRIVADDVYIAGHTDSGSAFARGSVNTTLRDGGDLKGHPPDEATQAGTEYGTRPMVDTHDFGEDQKYV